MALEGINQRCPFNSVERLFQLFAPPNRKPFCPLANLLKAAVSQYLYFVRCVRPKTTISIKKIAKLVRSKIVEAGKKNHEVVAVYLSSLLT